MGLPLFGGKSSSSFDTPYPVYPAESRVAEPRLPNSDPARYDVLDHLQIGPYLIVKLRYLDCTNYEGTKVMVYVDCTMPQLLKQRRVDPHFAETKQYRSPVARFEPTKRGWNMAVTLCVELTR